MFKDPEEHIYWLLLGMATEVVGYAIISYHMNAWYGYSMSQMFRKIQKKDPTYGSCLMVYSTTCVLGLYYCLAIRAFADPLHRPECNFCANCSFAVDTTTGNTVCALAGGNHT